MFFIDEVYLDKFVLKKQNSSFPKNVGSEDKNKRGSK